MIVVLMHISQYNLLRAWRSQFRALLVSGLFLLVGGMAVAHAGLVAGQFSPKIEVSPAGALVLHIPIEVPPGIAGMQPQLAFVYSSQGGNGPLGLGWGISGLGAISRCSQTKTQDNSIVGVSYTAADRFCLDGNRLMPVTGGYGNIGAEYRKEKEDFSKILSVGGSPGVPTSFIVQTKSGLKMEYGATSDSRIEAYSANTPRVWALNKITDLKGNSLTIVYWEDSINPYFYPVRIDYSGSNAEGSIVFDYESRPDVVSTYEAGSPLRMAVRMTGIRIFASGNGVHKYKLSYLQSANEVTPSQLSSISYCDFSENCFLPIEFVFDVGQGPSYHISGFNGSDLCISCGLWRSGDINGDGKMDLIHFISDKVVIWLSNGDGSYVIQYRSTGDQCVLDCGIWETGDINGDGLTDLVHITGVPGVVITWISEKNGTSRAVRYDAVIDVCLSTCGEWRVGDVNGDGRLDLIHLVSNRVITWLGDGNGSYSLIEHYGIGDSCVQGCGSWVVGDVNRDGLSDLIHLANNAGQVISWISSGNGSYGIASFSSQIDQCLNSCGYFRVADVNGDGIIDLIHFFTSGVYTWIGTGNGTYSVSSQTDAGDSCVLDCGYWLIGDLNGDGRSDLMHMTNLPGVVMAWIARSNGGYTVTGYTSAGDTCIISCGTWVVGDSDGDSKADLVHLTSNNGAVITWHSRYGRANPLSEIKYSGAVRAKVQYKSLASGASYSKDSSSLPLIDLQPALAVVDRLARDNGRGEMLTTTYAYGALKAELGGGRGPLGFRWIKALNGTLNVEDYSEFHQSWPFTGLVSKTERKLLGVPSAEAGYTRLGISTYSYSCRLPEGNACTNSPGNRYFIMQDSSVVNEFDVTGQSTALSRKYVQYGQWGDVTLVVLLDFNGTPIQTIANEYWPADTSSGKWILGRLKKSTTTTVIP